MTINVPAQSLRDALRAFGGQTGYSLLYPGDVSSALWSTAFNGNAEPRAALEIIIGNAPLEISYVKDRIIALRKVRRSSARPFRTVRRVASASPTPQGEDASIVVTGSRIGRRDYQYNSPLYSLSDDLLDRPHLTAWDDALFSLPQIAPGFGATSNDNQTGGVTTIDLRSLGVARTLVLLDGRRLTPTSSTGAVDLNLIPMSLVSSVEVITGGASATYGSDAIAGVVNFRLKPEVHGIFLRAQGGLGTRGDGATTRISLATGSAFFDDRGSVMAALEYSYRRGLNNQDRAFSRIGRLSAALPQGTYVPSATNLPDATRLARIFARYGSVGAKISPSQPLGFNRDGTLFTQIGALNYQAGAADTLRADDAVYFNSTGITGLSLPFQRSGFFGRMRYAVSDAIEVLTEGAYQNVRSRTVFGPGFFTFSVPVSSSAIPADLGNVLASRQDPAAPFAVTRRFAEVGPRTAGSETNGYRALVSVQGKIAEADGNWEIYATRGWQSLSQRDSNGVSISAVYDLLASADGGEAACGGLGFFGGGMSSRCASFIRRTTSRRTVAWQNALEGDLQLRVATLPAGDLHLAIGGGYRRNGFRFEPDAALESGDVISFANGALRRIDGSIRVGEIFAEALVPVLRNVPLASKVEFNLGYRRSQYDISGGVSSFRFEGSWTVNSSVRFRGGYARAVRAPNVVELYEPVTLSSPIIGNAGAVGQGDPCDVRGQYRAGDNAAKVVALCLAQGVPANVINSFIHDSTQLNDAAIVGGSEALTAEKSDSITVGAVLSSKRFGAFRDPTLTIDYYQLGLRDGIGRLDGAEVVRRCYNFGESNSDYNIANAYCNLFKRNVDTGQINELTLLSRNLGRVRTGGVDISFRTNVSVANDLDLRLSVVGSWVRRFTVVNIPNDVSTNLAGTIGNLAAYPQFKALANLILQSPRTRFTLQSRLVGGMKDVSTLGDQDGESSGIPPIAYFDISLDRKVCPGLTATMGVANAMDRDPPAYRSFKQSNTFPGLYDVVGRRVYIGISLDI